MKKIKLLLHLLNLPLIFLFVWLIYTQRNPFILISCVVILSILIIVLLIYFHYKICKIHKVVNTYDTNAVSQRRLLHLQETMLELSSQMTKVKGLNELLDIILQKAIDVIPEAEFGSILVINTEGQLEFKAIYGFDKELFDIKLYPEECYQWRATNGHFIGPMIIQDLSQFSKDFMNEETFSVMNEIDALSPKSSLSTPLLIDGQFFGSINIDSSKTHVFMEEHKRLMEYFANQATIAIRNHQYYEKMLFLSKYDDLTGAMNRNHFQEHAESMLAASIAKKEPLTFVLMDLNNFKSINDQYGHVTGDNLLIFFANSFSSQLSPADLFARYGGDEFIAVFYNSDINTTAEKLRTIHHKITKESLCPTQDKQEVHCYFAYGMAEFPLEGNELKTLIHLADQRMYLHKNELKHQ